MRVITIILFLFFTTDTFSQSLNDNLLLYYSFDGDVLDYSGNNYNGISFGTNYVSDRFGNLNSALSFDGVDDYISLPNINELKPDLPISFSLWVKFDDLTYENSTVFNTSFEEDVNSGLYMNIQSSTGKYQISYGDGSNFYSSSSRRTFTSNLVIESNEWHQIVIIVNSSQDMKIYVDCIDSLGDYSGFGGQLQYSDFPGVIGKHDRSLVDLADYFKGTLDDFRYWDRAITVDEINTLCNNGLNVNEHLIDDAFYVKIYPNPSRNGIFNLKSEYDSFTDLKVYNSLGTVVFSSNYQSEINLSRLPKGLYFVSIFDSEKKINKKLIIN